jgi:hypothetical protein
VRIAFYVALILCCGYLVTEAKCQDVQNKTKFFSYRYKWEDPALKPNKKSWVIFGAAHAAAFICLATANHQIEHPGSESAALSAVTVLDLAAFKFISPSMSLGGAVWGIQHYGRAH